MGRFLGPSEFGVIQFGVAIFIYIGFLNDLGLTTLGARGFGLDRDGKGLRADLLGSRMTLTAGVLVPVIFVLASGFLDPQDCAVAVSLTIGFALSAADLHWLLQFEERFGAIAIADAVGAVVQLAAVYLLVRGPSDVIAAAIAIVAGPAVSTAITVLFSRPGRSLLPRVSPVSFQLIRRAAPLGVALIATAIYYSVDSVILGLDRTTQEVGYYSAAYRIVLAGLSLPFLTHAVALPVISRLVRDHAPTIHAVLSGMSRGLLLLAVPLAVGATIAADPIIAAVFGDDFAPAVAPLRILIWTCVTVSANVPFAVLMLARHRDRAYMVTTLLGGGVNLCLNLAIVPSFGMIGSAWSTLASEAIVLGLILLFTRDTSIATIVVALRRAALPAAIMGVVIWPWRADLMAVPIGIVAFGLGAIVARAVTPAELKAIVRAARSANRGREMNRETLELRP
jgi:O-antigen/teichoic acid export membrane protein